MKKKTIIGCVIFISAILISLLTVCIINFDQGFTDEQERRMKSISDSTSCYYIMDTDGYVTVYLADQKTVFESTSIETNTLSPDIQKELKDGIKAETIGEVYGFLENYSS